jgi:C-terminal processing protease CtpA/Prc
MVAPSGTKLVSPKEHASEYLLGAMEGDAGSWSGLDESGADKVGIGLFFRADQDDGAIQVISMVPGSSAHLSGLVVVGDKLISIDNESVFGFSLMHLRTKLHGLPGTYAILDFERKVGIPAKRNFT